MTAPNRAHAVWLMRRAAILEGTSADTGNEPPDPARAAALQRIASKLSRAVEGRHGLELTADERTLLVTEAHDLADRAAHEIRRANPRDLERSEEWVRTARALREIVEASEP